jgi:hypothetical protein
MYSFRPDPEPAERDALVAALERLLGEYGEPLVSGSAWHRAALEEGVAPSEEDEADL